MHPRTLISLHFFKILANKIDTYEETKFKYFKSFQNFNRKVVLKKILTNLIFSENYLTVDH